MAKKSWNLDSRGGTARRTDCGTRAISVAVAALLTGSFLLAVSLAGSARAADAVAPQAVSRISVMSLGKFTFEGGGSVSFADSIACTSTNGCAGVFGFNFPQFNPLVQVSGEYACTPSDNPTTCAIAFTGGNAFACTLTVYLPPVPGDNNPVDISCSNPAGSGHGLTTLTILT